MTRSIVGVVLCCVGPAASATPLSVVHQGRLLATDGSPVEGPHDVTVSLYDGSNVQLFTDTFQDISFNEGYFSVVLGSGAPLHRDDFAPTAVFAAIALDGGAEFPIRQQLHSAPYAVQAGGVQFGAVTTCDAGSAGTVRYASGKFEGCDGTGWRELPTRGGNGSPSNPARSCRELKNDYPSYGSAIYTIDPNGAPTTDAYSVYCEMTLEGGGWTRIATIDGGTTICNMTAALGTTASVASGTGTAWLPAATVDAIPRVEKEVLVWDSATNYVRYTSANASWSWANVANGTINTSTVDTYAVLAQRGTETNYTALTDGLGCDNNPCLLAGYTPGSNWTIILGIGAYARGSFTQDASCASTGPTYKGIYGGTANAAWNQNGHVYIR